MLSCTYEVVAIDGDYAHLRRNDIEPEDNEMKLVARALLPALSWHLGNRADGSCFERVAADVFV